MTFFRETFNHPFIKAVLVCFIAVVIFCAGMVSGANLLRSYIEDAIASGELSCPEMVKSGVVE
jgi:hypothetical protein